MFLNFTCHNANDLKIHLPLCKISLYLMSTVCILLALDLTRILFVCCCLFYLFFRIIFFAICCQLISLTNIAKHSTYNFFLDKNKDIKIIFLWMDHEKGITVTSDVMIDFYEFLHTIFFKLLSYFRQLDIYHFSEFILETEFKS